MNRLALVVAAFLFSAPLQAQDPLVMADQILKLQQQVAVLEKQLGEMQFRMSGLSNLGGNLILNSGAGSIILKGSAVTLEGLNGIALTSGKGLTLTAGTTTNLTSGSAGAFNFGTTFNLTSGGNTTVQSAALLNIKALSDMSVETDRGFTMRGRGMSLLSTNFLLLQGSGVDVTTSGDISLKASGAIRMKATSILQN